MAKKNITTREDGVTKDMQPEQTAVRVYRFPSLNKEVKATSYEEALTIVKKEISNKK